MNTYRLILRCWMLMLAMCIPLGSNQVKAEALLQLFNVSWADITQKMPELAEAGYNSLWLPPPTKGSGGLSVGYDLFDPFDLGSKDQRNSVRTRYGTEAELLEMVTVAHRFGIRVYFDNIMNHRAFDVPGYDESTPADLYPGMLPEDFHLKKIENRFYRKWDNCRDWNSEWQVQNLGLADLIDIAHETPNTNHGLSEGDDQVKLSFIRDFDRPEQYDTDKDGNQAYFGVLIDQARAELGTNATSAQLRTKAQEYINARKSSFTEDVGGYLIRAVRWQLDRTSADGFRLDAVKHVPDYFFGERFAADKDSSTSGYLGGIQFQFNRSRGFSDVNQRDSVFEDKVPRDDAMVFGEHLGSPPGYSGYWNAGMRLVDNELRSQLNNRLGNPGSGLQGFDNSGSGGFAQGLGVTHANSHDSDYAAQKEWQHAYYMTREGMGLIYSDGYNKAETLGESGGAFPRHANTQYLGQFSDPRIPNILKIHNDFARGLQQGLWSDTDFVAFERRDNREPDGTKRFLGNPAQEVTMVVMMNDNTAQGQARTFNHSFGNGAYLFQYARGPGMVGFYSTNLSSVIVPPGGYFVFGWRTPELSNLWPEAAITLYQTNPVTGQLDEVPRITVTRKDGRDGDPSFNPDGLPNRGYPAGTTPVAYTYQTTVPVVKAGTPFTIVARADGSAENIMLKLDGGVNLNTNRLGSDPAWRDNPPGLRTDVWLGYEQPPFVERQNPEKFSAANSARCMIGSKGAETYVKTIGGSVTNNPGPTNANDWNSFGGTVVSWHYHDPNGSVGGTNVTLSQLTENPSNLVVWSKTPTNLSNFRMFIYYTTNGTTWPEGAGGIGRGETRVAEMNWRHDQIGADAGSWWSVTNVPKPTAGTQFRYKIGVYQAGAGSVWPTSSNNVSWKSNMLTTFRVANFNPSNVEHFPHNDYARIPTAGQPYNNWPWAMQTGLSEGFHILRARAFLNRPTSEAPLYQTFTQTFYYDAKTPEGVLAFPAVNGDTVGGSGYEMVVRTDPTVQEVWYSISDSDSSNDDIITRAQNGNGSGFEPFIDSNKSKAWEAGETFTDLNGNGTYDATLPGGEPYIDANQNGRWDSGESFTDLDMDGSYDAPGNWAKASEVTPSLAVVSPYQKEWRFTYNNIPLAGMSTISLRFLEASSSRNMTLSAAAANVTELSRNVQTRGTAERILIGYPANDGEQVDDNYLMRIWFPKSLSNSSISESDMISRFTFFANGNAQDRAGWYIYKDPTDNGYGSFGPGDLFHQLSIPLPNLYNSALDQQEFRIVYQDPNNPSKTFTAIRRVVVNSSSKPFIRITQPTVVGSDGRPTEISLPDGPGDDLTTYKIKVETGTNITVAPTISGIDLTNTVSSVTNGNIVTWYYDWRINKAGPYLIKAEATQAGQLTRTSRNASVVLRQIVGLSTNDLADDDNDGLLNIDEKNSKDLPTGNNETWTNGDVHIHNAYGKSLPDCVDSDGDGLPDGLEVGWRVPSSVTDTNADTNGDGVKNFRPDLDPPFYAVVENFGKVPGVGSQSQGDDRSRQAAGTVTDPGNPDTDGDGISDGVVDANKNGWVDGDGDSIAPTWNPWLARAWPDNIIGPGEIWKETSPTLADSDGDGLKDGYDEDTNSNGRTDLMLLYQTEPTKRILDLGLDTNNPNDPLTVAGLNFRSGDTASRAINYDLLRAAYSPNGNGSLQTNGWPKLLITETDPLNKDTDGDGLPDGWEKNNRLDPLDDGVYNYLTGSPGISLNGAAGDPDGDLLTNLQEFNAKSDPWRDDRPSPAPGNGSLRIGTFSDWKPDDLLAVDEYNNGGNVSDIYRNSYDKSRATDQEDYKRYYDDQYNSSRDLVAFSFRDGGDPKAKGDGNLYFRADFLDLQPDAWQGYVDLYVVINVGNTGAGEKSLPDEVDLTTTMGWQAVIAFYGQSGGKIYGTVYADLDTSKNTESADQNPATGNYGVVSRGVAANGLQSGAWSSTMDACEFSIQRQTLIELGWNGATDKLHFQVFTTRDGTQNNPAGLGDLPGRNDLRDSIGDDWVCSDYGNDQSNISLKGKLSSWFGRGDPWNDQGKAAKVLLLAHANEALQPASYFHSKIKTGTATNAPGYSRWLKVHEESKAPVSLHLTATLASGLQWANSTEISKDGPAFNGRIKAGVGEGWLDLLSSTFSDHILKYFPQELNRQNILAAREVLDGIYGASSRQVFWPCERVLDDASLEQLRQIGFSYTFADQGRHFQKWFGRSSAVGNNGYRINEVNGMRIIPIHDSASDDLGRVYDGGSPIDLRLLLSRRSRSGIEDQVVTLWRDLGDMGNEAILSPYETNVRWLVNRPWVKLVTATDIATGRVPYKGTDGNNYTTWGSANQGTNKTLALSAKDWVDHANQESYDNWYNGSSYEEGLRNKKFLVRSGLTNPLAFGQPGVSNTVADRVWTSLSSIDTNQPVSLLARSVMGASLFQTAFHNTTNNDLSKFSTGDYINPDTTTGQTLADFAKFSQAQTRQAAVYSRVQQWANSVLSNTLGTSAEDVDLDGENEYLLFNTRIFAIFERSGGRMTAAWMRDPSSGSLWQVAGNLASYSNSETEDEGTSNVIGSNNVVNAYRTSGFKDWWVVNTGGTGNSSRVNSLYYVAAATDGTTGWVMNSQDGVTKTIRLANASSDRLTATYSLTGLSRAYLRFGLSPNLQDLMIRGQTGLAVTSPSTNRINVANVATSGTVRAFVQVSSDTSNPGNSSSINTGATDTDGLAAFSTINLRNQAQTQQVEVSLAGLGPHTVTLAFDQGTDNNDTDADGLPDTWEISNFGNLNQTASADPDGDGLSNLQEYIFGSNPNSSSSGLPTVGVSSSGSSGFTISFPTVSGRKYQVIGSDNLSSSNWPTVGSTITGDGTPKSVIDSSSTNSTRKFYKVNVSVP